MRVFLLSLVITVLTASGALAETGDITKKMIDEKYAQLEKALNSRNDYGPAIKFLHDNISEDARFRVTVTNPTVAQSGKSPVMELTKQDYINTYIQGTHHVADYEMDITTAGFQYDPGRSQAFTLDIMTERGTMPNELNDGKPFVSRTTCRTAHELREGSLVATASECHTDISFEEEI